jgi:hypothetical protein
LLHFAVKLVEEIECPCAFPQDHKVMLTEFVFAGDQCPEPMAGGFQTGRARGVTSGKLAQAASTQGVRSASPLADHPTPSRFLERLRRAALSRRSDTLSTSMRSCAPERLGIPHRLLRLIWLS